MKSVPASQFRNAHAHAHHRPLDPRKRKLHVVWKRIRGRFLLPEKICDHSSAWEIYDADLAGCKQCGCQHVCSEESCTTELNEQGHSICTLTGVCVRDLNFSQLEYVDTAVSSLEGSSRLECGGTAESHEWQPLVGSYVRQVNLLSPPSNTFVETLLYNDAAEYLGQILCTHLWQQSMDMEDAKLDDKKHACMWKTLKDMKSANPLVLPIIPDAVARTASMVGNYRISQRASEQERSSIAAWCTSSIFKHICLLNRVSPGTVSYCKLRSCTVGLLYLMRQGIVTQGVIVLPRLRKLKVILPIENHLQSVFGIRGKCITETENTVKMAMKHVGRDSLKFFGVSGIDTKLPRCGEL